MLRRVAHVINADIKVVFELVHGRKNAVLAEARAKYGEQK